MQRSVSIGKTAGAEYQRDDSNIGDTYRFPKRGNYTGYRRFDYLHDGNDSGRERRDVDARRVYF